MTSAAATQLLDLQAAHARLVQAAAIVVQAFDDGVFCRNTDGDDQPGWSLRLLAPLRALSILAVAAGQGIEEGAEP